MDFVQKNLKTLYPKEDNEIVSILSSRQVSAECNTELSIDLLK